MLCWDEVVKPSTPPTGTTCADCAPRDHRRTSARRQVVKLLGALGVLALLVSAILPDDDASQQDWLGGGASVRILGQHTRKAVVSADSLHIRTVFGLAARPGSDRPQAIARTLYTVPVSVSEEHLPTPTANRAPPLSA